MSDNPELRGGRDRSTIALDQSYEISYIHQQFPWFSRDEIIDAVKKKGPLRETVVDFLQQKSGAVHSSYDGRPD